MSMKNVSLYDVPLDLLLKYYKNSPEINEKLNSYKSLQDVSFKKSDIFYDVTANKLAIIKESPNSIYLGYKTSTNEVYKTKLVSVYGKKYDKASTIFSFESADAFSDYVDNSTKYLYHVIDRTPEYVYIKRNMVGGPVLVPVINSAIKAQIRVDGEESYKTEASLMSDNTEISFIVSMPTDYNKTSFSFIIDYLDGDNSLIGSDVIVVANTRKRDLITTVLLKPYPKTTAFNVPGYDLYQITLPVTSKGLYNEYVTYGETVYGSDFSSSGNTSSASSEYYIKTPTKTTPEVLGIQEKMPTRTIVGKSIKDVLVTGNSVLPIDNIETPFFSLEEDTFNLTDIFAAFSNASTFYNSYNGTSETAIVGTELDSKSVEYRKNKLTSLSSSNKTLSGRGNYLYNQSLTMSNSRNLYSMYDFSNELKDVITDLTSKTLSSTTAEIPLVDIDDVNYKLILEKKATDTSTDTSETVSNTVTDNRNVYERIQSAKEFPNSQLYLNLLKELSKYPTSPTFVEDTEFRKNIYINSNGEVVTEKEKYNPFIESTFNIVKTIISNNVIDTINYQGENIRDVLDRVDYKNLSSKIYTKTFTESYKISEKAVYGKNANISDIITKINSGDWSVL